MTEYTPPPPKALTGPQGRSYDERKKAEELTRAENNRRTKQSYRLRDKPGQGHASTQGWKGNGEWKGPDSTGPTRDMPPVKLGLKKPVNGEPCDVVSLAEYKQKREEKKQ